MTLSYPDDGETLTHSGRVERRGGFSISFPKHSYEIDLKEDVAPGGLPADDDWILNANYIDKTFLRHVVSYELFAEMRAENEAPQCRYVEVALNGQYQGLYVLMEKLDRSTLGLDKSDPAAVIFKEPQVFRETYGEVSDGDSTSIYHQTYPKVKDDDKSAFIENLRSLILRGPEATFRRDIEAAFDLENLIDWHLLLLVTNNGDGILKNFYLYKADADTPVRIAPWDYDHSFGRDGDNELNLDERPLRMERSILFARLLLADWYTERLKHRWEELNASGLLSEAGLKERVLAKSELIRGAAEKNFTVWPLDGPWYYDANGYDAEMDIMLHFITLRHRRLRGYFAGR